MSEEELQEAIKYNQEYTEAQLSEEIFGGDYTSAVELGALEKAYDKLQQENKELKKNIEIKNAYCQLIADLGFDYDGLNQVSSLKGLIDELVKYALASRDNDDGIVVYEDGFNKKYNVLNEELEDK